MAKSKNSNRIQNPQCKKPNFCGHDKRLLLDYNVPTRLEEIEKLADAVDKVLPDRDLAFAANLCMEELITNTILHGLKGVTDRFIHVQMSISNECLEILLKDDAPPFDPFIQAPKPMLEPDMNKRPVGGLGVHLVKKLMDEVHAYYDGTGNLFVLHKALKQQAS